MIRHLITVMSVCAFLTLGLVSCGSPCEEYCSLLADCIEDEWGGDYELYGYADWQDAHDECLDRHQFPGGPAIQRANQNSCRLLADAFDLEDCI